MPWRNQGCKYVSGARLVGKFTCTSAFSVCLAAAEEEEEAFPFLFLLRLGTFPVPGIIFSQKYIPIFDFFFIYFTVAAHGVLA